MRIFIFKNFFLKNLIMKGYKFFNSNNRRNLWVYSLI
jgi:hypothetical protein